MRCPSCATDNAPASAYCVGCGVALPTHGGEPPAAYHGSEPPAAYHGGEPPAAYQLGEPPAAYHVGEAPAAYQAQAGYEMPPQYGPGWQPAPPYHGQPEDQYQSQPQDQYQQQPQDQYQHQPQDQYQQQPQDPYHGSPQDPFAAYQTPTYLAPPPYADNAGPAYPTWLSSPTSGPGVPVSGTPMSGAPVSPGYPAAYPTYPPPVGMAASPRPRSRSMVGLVVAVAVVVVVAVASFAAVTLTSHKKTPLAAPTGPASLQQQSQQPHSQTPQPTRTTDQNITATTAAPDPAIAHNQAAAIDSLLTASVNSRRKLNNAIDEVNRCTNLDGAVSDMNAAGQERQSQITSVRSTDLSAIPTGGQVRDLLLQALQYSQQADASFAAWAQGAVDNGCTDSGQRDRDYAEAQRLSGLAKQAKTDFLATWNPVASANGVSARSPDDI